ncbi:hypothetical protein L208DRAFT_1390061 [Tricholoma matsutake]|nr:hypothetical protein L208DRAFT_1390061 [Tricholoma matsutake 945]
MTHDCQRALYTAPHIPGGILVFLDTSTRERNTARTATAKPGQQMGARTETTTQQQQDTSTRECPRDVDDISWAISKFFFSYFFGH